MLLPPPTGPLKGPLPLEGVQSFPSAASMVGISSNSRTWPGICRHILEWRGCKGGGVLLPPPSGPLKDLFLLEGTLLLLPPPPGPVPAPLPLWWNRLLFLLFPGGRVYLSIFLPSPQIGILGSNSPHGCAPVMPPLPLCPCCGAGVVSRCLVWLKTQLLGSADFSCFGSRTGDGW